MQRRPPTVRQLESQADYMQRMIDLARVEERTLAAAYVNTITPPIMRLMQLLEIVRTATRTASPPTLDIELKGMDDQLEHALLNVMQAYLQVEESMAQRNPKLLMFVTEVSSAVREFLRTGDREPLRELTKRLDDPVMTFSQEPTGLSGEDIIAGHLAAYKVSMNAPKAADLLFEELDTKRREGRSMTAGEQEARNILSVYQPENQREAYRAYLYRVQKRNKR